MSKKQTSILKEFSSINEAPTTDLKKISASNSKLDSKINTMVENLISSSNSGSKTKKKQRADNLVNLNENQRDVEELTSAQEMIMREAGFFNGNLKKMKTQIKEHEFSLNGSGVESDEEDKKMQIDMIRKIKIEKRFNKNSKNSSSINSPENQDNIDCDFQSDNYFKNFKINIKKEIESSQTEFAWNDQNIENNSNHDISHENQSIKLSMPEEKSKESKLSGIQPSQYQDMFQTQFNNNDLRLTDLYRRPMLKLVNIKKEITKLILKRSFTFKRIKTEKSNVKCSGTKDFVSIYKELKKKHPGLSVQSYFIACLHSAKETDMMIVNSHGSDTDLAFSFQY